MLAPETIQINLNAADGYARFTALGIEATPLNGVTPEQITTMLAAQQNRMFRLFGRVAGFASELSLRIDAASSDGLVLTNCVEPPFTDTYKVASEPPPNINTGSNYGDYEFVLHKVAE